MNDFFEEQGPIAGWCHAIHLFETAAKAAGAVLNGSTFVTAMSKIKNPRHLVLRITEIPHPRSLKFPTP